MTVNSTPRRAGPFLGNGVSTEFPFAFKVFSAADVALTYTDTVLGTDTLLVLGTDYTVALNPDQDASPGGTITYPISGSPLPASATLVVIGSLEYNQPLDLPAGGNFSPIALENQLDRVAIQLQQIAEAQSRSFTFSASEGTIPVFPPVASRANKLLGFDATGQFIGVVPTPGDASGLALDLANGTVPTKGVGQVAYGPTLAYPAGTAGAKLRQSITFEDFGAVGDGVTNDTAAMRLALAYAVTLGIGHVYGTAGKVYRVTLNLLVLTPTQPLTVDFRGATVDASALPVNTDLMHFTGSAGTYVNLTANVAQGDRRVLVGSTATFTRGGWVKLVSEAVWDASNTSTKIGELNRLPISLSPITALQSTVLELANPTADAYTTATTARIAPVAMAPRVVVRNGRFVGRTGNQNDGIGLRFTYVDGPLVEGCEFVRWDTASIFIKHCPDFNVSNCNFSDARPTGLGYGVEVSDTSCDGVVDGCHFDDVRHALSLNNTTSSDNGIVRRVTLSNNTVRNSAPSQGVTSAFTANTTTNELTLGTPSDSFTTSRIVTLTSTGALPAPLVAGAIYWTRKVSGSPTAVITLHNSIADGESGANVIDITTTGTGTHTAQVYGGGDAIDTHGGADFIKIIGNTVLGASGSGINIECPNVEVTGNTVTETQAVGIFVHSEVDRNARAVVSNNRVSRAASAGIMVSQGSRGTAFSYQGITIAGNTVTDCALRPSMFLYNGGITVLGRTASARVASITGNTVVGCGSYGVQVEQGRACNVVGNSLYNNAAEPVLITDTTYSTVGSNVCQVGSSAAYPGVRVAATSAGASSRLTISGNSTGPVTGTGTAVAIVLDNNVTNTNVSGNVAGAMAGTVTLGSGSGNVSVNNT
jgi:Right handed beta helix region